MTFLLLALATLDKVPHGSCRGNSLVTLVLRLTSHLRATYDAAVKIWICASANWLNVLADLQLTAEYAESQDVDGSITTLLDS